VGRKEAEAYRLYRAPWPPTASTSTILRRLPSNLLQSTNRCVTTGTAVSATCVDEYQDRRATQLPTDKLLVTAGRTRAVDDWGQRSVFVVRDADQKHLSFGRRFHDPDGLPGRHSGDRARDEATARW